MCQSSSANDELMRAMVYEGVSVILGFLVTRSSILILIFQREVLYKYYYCHVVFEIFEKF